MNYELKRASRNTSFEWEKKVEFKGPQNISWKTSTH